MAFLIKGTLTIITFGLRVPAGIYIPSMIMGGLLGKIVGHTVQLSIAALPHASLFMRCNEGKEVGCVTPGFYAMIPVTLAVVLFELTANLDYIIPASIAIIASKWVADAIESSSIYVSQQ